MSSDSPPVIHSPSFSAQPVKGILKRPASRQQHDERAPRLKWNEENLAITEAQKDSTMKIDEPKTPYVYYDHDNDKVMDVDDAFTLDGERKRMLSSGSLTMQRIQDDNKEDQDEDGNEDEEVDGEDEDEDDEEEPEEWQDSDEEDEGDEKPHKPIDHDKFAKLRAEHYNMKEALRLGHELVEEELDSLDSPTESGSGSGSGSVPVPPLPSFAKQQNAALGLSKSKKDEDSMDL